MSDLKVLICAPHIRIPGVGGAATHHTEFSKALARQDIEVHMLVDCKKEMMLNGVNLYPSKISNVPPSRLSTSWSSVGVAEKICKENNINIIHDRSDPAQITGHLVSRKLGIPMLAEVNYNFMSYEIKNSFFRDTVLYPEVQMFKKWWLNGVIAEAQVVTCVSGTIKQSLVKHGIDAAKIRVVPNGADPAYWRQFRKHAKTSTDYTNLLLLGELGPRQGVIELIKAVQNISRDYPNIKLYIAGGDKRYSKYLQEAKDLAAGSENIIFTGIVEGDEKAKLVMAADVTLVPYRESWSSESFGFSPIKMFEYFAAGKIVLATDTPWNREIIVDGENGLLTPFDKLEDGIKRAIRVSMDSRRSAIESNARKLVEEKYNWINVARSYIKIYRSMLDS